MASHEISMESNSVQETEEVQMENPSKQQLKKQRITPTKIVIGVAIFCILALVSYQVWTIAFPSNTESKMDMTHSKIK